MSDVSNQTAPVAVLVCERSQVQRRILCNLLRQVGLSVSAVATDEEALEHLQATSTDIFITGIEVGRRNGSELCWHLKSHPETVHIYTMVVTASGDPCRVVEALDAGADDFVRKPFDEAELRARLRAASRIVRMQRSLKVLAETDPLTGAANRRFFMRRLHAEISRSARHRVPLSVVMLDLDHFKRINDTQGHAVGDDVLVSSVRTLREGLRGEDVVGRLGGEEFAIILPHTEAAQAFEAADRLRRDIAAMRIELGSEESLSVSASFGVARFSEENETAESLLQAADAALYAAKAGGRNCVELSCSMAVS